MYEDDDSDCLDFGGDSDDDTRAISESSEDELEMLLNATPEKRKQHLQRQKQKTKDGVEDDFEKEMNAELQETVAAIEEQRRQINQGSEQGAGRAHTSTNDDPSSDNAAKFYDDVYFDSDEEGGDKADTKSPKRKHPVPTNDDLLYDPNMDDEDEKWVKQQQQRNRLRDGPTSDGKKKKLTGTDAVLDCPACMTTLCRDCQRHDVYENQYRAMFVTSCVVDTGEFLKFPEQRGNKKKKSKRGEDNENEDEKFNPVKCEECNTVVAMFDTDEVYHFFNVLASYS